MSPSTSSHQARAKTLCTLRTLTVACANQTNADFVPPDFKHQRTRETSFVYLTNATGTSKSKAAADDLDGKASFQLHTVPMSWP
jgi:hypothetical protein